MILMIDNYDSFTYNLVQYFRELTHEVQVYRNDEIQLTKIENLHPDQIIISPGPGNPDEAGISLKIIQQFAGKIPILGVCLGHQTIAQAFGGVVKSAGQVMHGKTSSIVHSQQGVFQHLPSPLSVTRYHSLIVDKPSLPKEFEITAWTTHEDGRFDEIMAIRHRLWALEGVQFHPESILTQYGKEMLNNFLRDHCR